MIHWRRGTGTPRGLHHTLIVRGPGWSMSCRGTRPSVDLILGVVPRTWAHLSLLGRGFLEGLDYHGWPEGPPGTMGGSGCKPWSHHWPAETISRKSWAAPSLDRLGSIACGGIPIHPCGPPVHAHTLWSVREGIGIAAGTREEFWFQRVLGELASVGPAAESTHGELEGGWRVLGRCNR